MQRLIASRALVSPLSSMRLVRLPAASFNRFLSTCSSGTGSSDAVAPAKSFSEIVGRHGGWYPLGALTGAILLSKEVLVVNEEMLLSTNFLFVVFAIYVMGGDAASSWAASNSAERVKEWDDVTDCAVSILQSKIARHQAKIDEVPVFQALKESFSTLSAKAAANRQLKLRLAAREAVVRRLNELLQRQEEEQRAATAALIDNAVAYVQAEWSKAGPQEKAKFLNQSIEILEGKKVTDEHPIIALFEKYFKQRN